MRPDDDLFLTIDHNLHPGQPPLALGWSDDETEGQDNLEDLIGDNDDALISAGFNHESCCQLFTSLGVTPNHGRVMFTSFGVT
ncbi:hypothetical protein ACFCWX_22405, partial [Streptomyces sp. NPDC056405]